MRAKKKPFTFFLYTNIVIVVLTFLSAMATVVDPRSIWIFSFFGLVFHFLVIINFLFIIGWIFTRLRNSIVSIVCLLFLSGQVNNSFGLNLFSDDIEEVHSFSVMSYNTSNFYKNTIDNKKRKNTIKSARKFISKKIIPDILCTQELSGYSKKSIEQSLPNHNHYSFKNKGASIFSIFPIINKGQIDFLTITNSCLWADIIVYDDTIRVYSAHLQSNKISNEAEKLLSEKTIDEKRAWNSIKSIFSRYKKYSVRRASQADQIKAHIDQSPYPVVLCGDLNDTPLSYTYTIVRSKMNDTFLEKGFGLGVSFAGKIPGLRIDYILASPAIKVIAYKRYNVAYSDHFPIYSVLKLDPK